MIRNRPVSLALVGLFVWVVGCTSYTQIEPSQVADYGEVRVTTNHGDRVTLREARVEADSIKGRDTQAIRLDYVAEIEGVVEHERKSVGQITGIVVLSAIVVVAFVAGMVWFLDQAPDWGER